MNKTLKTSGLALMLLLAVSSCKKNEQADPLPETENAMYHEQESQTAPAVNIPLTTANFTKQEHDFGTLKKGEIVQHIYEITNTGDQPLVISEVRPACGCTVPDYTKEPIAPGKKGQVTLSFDSKNFTGETHKTAEVFTNTENAPFVLSFKANVQ